MSKKKSSDFEIAPLRTLDDFLLEAARFQIPNLKDLEKWGNRVTRNLLYYQTNYFLMSILIFVIVGVIHPIKMACGFLATAVIFFCVCDKREGNCCTIQKKSSHHIGFNHFCWRLLCRLHVEVPFGIFPRNSATSFCNICSCFAEAQKYPKQNCQ
ncbi:hypothetical protein JTB14_011837 [Gonioctena quinquepunctata]|nr:hypothetical protein JTB14_011837 [Gonioctena quinquepunctata]